MNVLDLFCGAGGFAQGFRDAAFNVTGVDVSEYAGKTLELNRYGRFKKADLTEEIIKGEFDVVVGGPPCKPWSAVNTAKRSVAHQDFILLSRFFEHTVIIRLVWTDTLSKLLLQLCSEFWGTGMSDNVLF